MNATWIRLLYQLSTTALAGETLDRQDFVCVRMVAEIRRVGFEIEVDAWLLIQYWQVRLLGV